MGQKVHPYGFRLGFTKPWKSLGAAVTLRRNVPSGEKTCSPAVGSCTLTYTSPAELTAMSPCWLPSCSRPCGSFNQSGTTLYVLAAVTVVGSNGSLNSSSTTAFSGLPAL